MPVMSILFQPIRPANNCGALRDLVHLYNLKNMKNTHGGVLLLVLKVKSLYECFSRFFKLYKWYNIAQNVSIACLTHFTPMFSSLYPWKFQTFGFLTFSGVLEIKHWREAG